MPYGLQASYAILFGDKGMGISPLNVSSAALVIDKSVRISFSIAASAAARALDASAKDM